MATEQREAYDGATEVASDPLGLIPRENRNHKKKQRLILDTTAADRGDNVLEVGCGHGLHLPWYADRFDIVAVDLSDSLCRSAQRRCPMADVQQADARNLPFDDDAFDAVVGTAILHHLPDATGALTEWSRVARQSVTLVEPNYLFPLAFATTHLQPEERHKRQMAPWRIRKRLSDVPGDATVEPVVYTPPVPESLENVYDCLDSAVNRIPGVRWLSQLLLIHVELS